MFNSFRLFIVVAAITISGCQEEVHHRKVHFSNGVLEQMDYKGDTSANFIGNVTDFYPTGEIHEKYRLKNWELDGEYTTYYKSGNILSKSFYANNKLESIERDYRENGRLAIETQYKNNKINGMQIIFLPDGSLAAFNVWKDSVPIYSLIFDSLGKIRANFLKPYLKFPRTISLGEKFRLEITLPYVRGFNHLGDFNIAIIPKNLVNDTLNKYLLYTYKVLKDQKWHYGLKKLNDAQRYSYNGPLNVIHFDTNGNGVYEFTPKDTGQYVFKGVMGALSAQYLIDSIINNDHLLINFTVTK